MKYTVLYNPKCGTCKKVKAIFQQYQFDVEYYDYTVKGFDSTVLTPIIDALLKRLNGNIAQILRPTDERRNHITAAELMQHLLDNPMNIQRPIVFDQSKGTAFIARPAQTLLNELSI